MSKVFRLMLAGNPNVGKSTIFNALTGMHQHTGNWTGKTVELARGSFSVRDQQFQLTDLPGTYSIAALSVEEEVARDAICFEKTDYTLVLADATCLSRHLTLVLQILELTPNVALCINFMDEAKRKGIRIDLDALKRRLGIPVLGISAKNKKDIRALKAFLYSLTCLPFSLQSKALVRYTPPVEDAAERLCAQMKDFPPLPFRRRFLAVKALNNPALFETLLQKTTLSKEEKEHLCLEAQKELDALTEQGYSAMDIWDITSANLIESSQTLSTQCTHQSQAETVLPSKTEKLLTSKKTGIPVMLSFLALLLWITISFANIPSDLLFAFFQWLEKPLSALLSFFRLPDGLSAMLIDGVYQCTVWVVSVMMPPMLIFFPLFTLLEDLGVLPRLAFNLDRCFQKAGSCGKQALTMCMGLGCNAVGVTGCRIIHSPRERLLAMLTNAFVPCNGRFPLLIALLSIFVVSTNNRFFSSVLSALSLTALLLLAVLMTLLATWMLSATVLKGAPSSFVLELPPYRKPQVLQTLLHAVKDRCLRLLGRAVSVAAPFGILLYLLANLSINGTSLLSYVAAFLDPFARFLGLDGVILMAFLLSFPANELFLPILFMGYLSASTLTDLSSLVQMQEVFLSQGWTLLTALNVMIFSMMHWPCSTTVISVYKETKSVPYTLLSVLLPTLFGILLCALTNGAYNLFLFDAH